MTKESVILNIHLDLVHVQQASLEICRRMNVEKWKPSGCGNNMTGKIILGRKQNVL